MVTVLTLTSVRDQMTVSKVPSAGIQWEATDVSVKVVSSETGLTVTRASALMKHSVDKMNNVLARQALIANVKRASPESLLIVHVKIRTSVVRTCTIVHKRLSASTHLVTTCVNVIKGTPVNLVAISMSA